MCFIFRSESQLSCPFSFRSEKKLIDQLQFSVFFSKRFSHCCRDIRSPLAVRFNKPKFIHDSFFWSFRIDFDSCVMHRLLFGAHYFFVWFPILYRDSPATELPFEKFKIKICRRPHLVEMGNTKTIQQMKMETIWMAFGLQRNYIHSTRPILLRRTGKFTWRIFFCFFAIPSLKPINCVQKL